jgi:hypothetical protein
MTGTFKSVAAAVAVALAGSLLIPGRASASCAMPGTDGSPQQVMPGASTAFGLQQASFVRVSDPFADASDSGWSDANAVPNPHAAIVGLWKVSFRAKGNTDIPDGAPIDDGYVTWHADGTELMNSGRPPMTGSFCMGVWKQIDTSTFKLNHVALSWDPTGTVFVGPTSIRETVTVNETGRRYRGRFTITQYAVDGTTVLAVVKGTIEATRVTVN